jgi:organic radical activating enzyme
MRGDSENVKADVHKQLESFDSLGVTQIETLGFSGGEPFLNLGGIESVIDGLILRKAQISDFVINTNGTVYNDEVVGILRKLSSYVQDSANSTILISDSAYHKECKSVDYATVKEYYRRNGINVATVSEFFNVEFTLDSGVKPIGRASNLPHEIHNCNHCIKDMCDFYTKKSVYIDVYGGINFCSELAYVDMIGNLQTNG